MSASTVRRLGRCLVLLAVFSVVVPTPSVQPARISLTTVETAKSVDFGDGVLWVLVLGSDARPGLDVDEGLTDAIQLVGINWRTGRAVGIGVPRDAWVDLPDGFARINTALGTHGPDVAARAVADIVGISPDLVLVTGFDGFLSMTEALGGVDVESPIAFRTEGLGVVVRRGTNTFAASEALDFARTRRALTGGDFIRSANHQRLLLGALRQLRAREDEEGFMEKVALAAIGGLETDLSPPDLYRFLQAITQVDPARAKTCVIGGTPGIESGASIVYVDEAQARALGDDARDDARLQGGCRDGS